MLIDSVLKPECVDCRSIMKGCCDCPFTAQNYRYFRVKRLHGLNSRYYGMMKHHLYYFMYHPELDFKYPTLPDFDYLGNCRIDGKRWHWVVHHEDGNSWNDREWNLLLMLHTEHFHVHQKQFPMSHYPGAKEWLRGSQFKKMADGKHHFQSFEWQSKAATKANRTRIEDGSHNLLGWNNPNKDKKKSLLDYLVSLPVGIVKLTHEDRFDFGYSDKQRFRNALKDVISEIPNIDFVITCKSPGVVGSRILKMEIIKYDSGRD